VRVRALRLTAPEASRTMQAPIARQLPASARQLPAGGPRAAGGRVGGRVGGRLAGRRGGRRQLPPAPESRGLAGTVLAEAEKLALNN